MKRDAVSDVAAHRATMPHGTGAILDTRSLATDHRRLAGLLAPDMSVLDVGCGTGAITRGIAEAVGPRGRVVGVDVKAELIEAARRRHADVPGLSFAIGDVHQLPSAETFDIVTAARVLQWLAWPGTALRAMAATTRPGGRVVVLEYNHEKIAWSPAPPASMRRFYDAFLAWRAEAGMDNAIADHLASMFADAGLEAVRVSPQHETTKRGEPDFETRAGIWADVAATRGHQMVADGTIDEATRARAEVDYRRWVADSAEAQTMYLLAVDGVRPARVNLAEKFARFSDHWSPKVVGNVNDMHVKVVKISGEFVWHHHDHEDELFLVVNGRLRMRLRDGDKDIGPGEFIIVPRGTEHCPVALTEEVHIVLLEPKTAVNTGNVVNERTVTKETRL